MATRVHKHFRLDPMKIKRAPDRVISEHERNRLTMEAHKHFVTRGIVVKDLYGTLES